MNQGRSASKTITNQTFTTTQVVNDVIVEPSVGLYQPVYPLTEAEFMKLRQSSMVFSAIAGSLISFGLAYALPLLVNHALSDPKTRAPLKQADLWVAGLTIAVGLVLLGASFTASTERRSLLTRIKKHFSENPGQHEIRMGQK
jgi:hypothetical protein